MEEPAGQAASDPIVAQILADCAQVSGELSPDTEPIESITRRRFLKGAIGAGVAASAWASVSRESSAQLDTLPADGESLEPLVPVVEVTSDKAWKDDVLDEQIVSEMMDRAVMKLAGRDSAKQAWKDFVLPDDIVGIKVNPLAGKQFSTRRVIVDKIIEGLYGAGVLKNQIVIWDRFEAHLIDAGYEINQTDRGVRVYATDSPGVGYDDTIFYETEKDSVIRRENDGIKSRYSKIVTRDLDVIINVPVMKHHAMTGVSGCLKNLAFGSVDNTRRFHPSPLHCDPAVAEVFDHEILRGKVVLNIVDGLLASFDGGPMYSSKGEWKYGGILMSRDPVALDQIVLRSVGDKREEQGLPSITRLSNHIRSAWRADIGTNDLDEMDIQQIKV
ncbi:MAG: DUF362 domain-containing protein [Candidatus Poribacteria bacterium]|nr:DUF362 domain-containing protein [Candidatus Poribacteria bacterium]MDE0506181.1 DUF362 domain-containing protein [Candidatus Poribacteria bacterium]